MIFTLIKNELIKLLKKSKTWIVFALFALCVIGMGVISNLSAKDMRHITSPQGQIDQMNSSIKHLEDNNKRYKENNSNEPWVEEAITSNTTQINQYKEQIKKQEEKIKNGADKSSWKAELEDEKKEIEGRINDKTIPDESKTHDKERLEEIKVYLDKNLEPIPEWEFDATNYSTGFIKTIGLIILVAGISVFMSDIVSGESTPPTLKFLLVQPISRGKVILSKFISVVITVVAMIGGLQILAFGVLGAITGFDGMKMPTMVGTQYKIEYIDGYPQMMQLDGSGIMSTRGDALIQSFALQLLFIVACCAFIFLISALFKSSMITMALSVIISVASTMICMVSSTVGGKFAHLIFLNYGNTPSVVSGDVAYMFRNVNFNINLGIGLMLGTIVVSYIIAHVVFSKKDILI